jgi:hypothetical protein
MCTAQQRSPFSRITWIVDGSISLSEAGQRKRGENFQSDFLLSMDSFMEEPNVKIFKTF